MTQKVCIMLNDKRIIDIKPAETGKEWRQAPPYIDQSWTFDGSDYVAPTLSQEALIDPVTNEIVEVITSDPISKWITAGDEVTSDWSYDGTNFVAPPAPVIGDVKTDAKKLIDLYAEQKRQEFITSGSGQAMTYANKAAEITAFIAAGYPVDLTDYPYITAEVAATGLSPTNAANNIKMLRDIWVLIDVRIEELRIGGKKLINDAVSITDADAQKATTIAAINAISG